jgi:hypothetical protein
MRAHCSHFTPSILLAFLRVLKFPPPILERVTRLVARSGKREWRRDYGLAAGPQSVELCARFDS